MTLLIFFGILLATALLAFDTINNVKEMLTPAPVRANNGR
ncbi:hypothetical protein SAMN06269173_103483 [Hymenobacter mucosus]|uniref:Uncharacterized protein n=1 Tax=Hymenobacter mucosus TaxID=1411120 RepID=A0A238X4D3_9BACT|nr:hypothetical protein SAMN06269173_103483 [Hymenobacter mucosus]